MRIRLPTARLATRLLVGVVLLAVAAILFGRPLLVDFHLRAARAAIQARDAELALARLAEAERLDPHRVETQFLLARAHRRLARYDRVREHIERAARLGADRETLRREEWLALAQSGQLRKAEPHLPALLRDPRDDGPEICEAFVHGYFATYQFSRAYPILEAWKAQYPDDPQPHVFDGAILEHSALWTEAAAAYRRGLEMAPRRHDVRLRLAKLLVRLHEYEEAIEHFRECLAATPEDPEVLVGLGTCARARGRTEEARELFSRALARDGEHFDARLAMGRLELAVGNMDEALRWLRPVSEERPHDTEGRYALARALQATGAADEAREHFQFIADARQALLEAGKLRDAARTNPDDYEMRHRLGAILIQYDDPSHGAAWLRSALELRPDHVPTHQVLAAYYEKTGNREMAERHRREAGASGRPSGVRGGEGSTTDGDTNTKGGGHER